MQAEHSPVHLGPMPAAVAAVLGEEQRPGVAWILNDPSRGGTHLPAVTLISPVFADGELLGFAASRAHHADIGGASPGGTAALSGAPDREGGGDPPTPPGEGKGARRRQQKRRPRPAPPGRTAREAPNP